MKYLRSFAFAGCLIAFLCPSKSHAFALAGGASFWDNNLGEGANLRLYPQWEVGFGLTPELEIGVHYAKADSGLFSGTQHFLYIPAMVGLRFDAGRLLPLGILDPFAAAHLGYGRLEDFGDAPTGGSDNFAYNFAVGLNLMLGEVVSIGVQGGLDIIVGNDSSLDEKIYSVDVLLTL